MVSATPSCSLDVDQIYGWRARAVWQGRHGPWSTEATFRATAGGGINDDGVYDPLVNGQTVGEIFGDVTFIPERRRASERPRQPHPLPPADGR